MDLQVKPSYLIEYFEQKIKDYESKINDLEQEMKSKIDEIQLSYGEKLINLEGKKYLAKLKVESARELIKNPFDPNTEY